MIGGKSLKVAFLLGGYYNYYHHLIDYMVNFFAVGDWIGGSSVPILTLKATHKFQHEINAAFGIKEQIYEMDPLSNVKVKSLLVPPKAVVGDGVVRDKQILKHCTDYLTRKVGQPHQSALRLFISRARAGTRRAVNEASAIKVASSYGFIPINLEDLAFVEQVSLFMAAEAVAGLHGAGFANIIFSKPGCLVIEFLPTDKWKPQFFQNLSSGMGHRFIRIDAAGEFSSTTLEIDIDRFSEVLSKNFG
jgi:capsular polysaccharide biosynthesis protein